MCIYVSLERGVCVCVYTHTYLKIKYVSIPSEEVWKKSSGRLNNICFEKCFLSVPKIAIPPVY